MLRTVVLVLFALVSMPARAQMPTDIDLRSAYCIGVLEQQVQSLEKDIVEFPEMREWFVQPLKQAKSDLDRLRSYIVPRSRAMYGDGIAAAKTRGVIDHANAEGQRRTCARNCRTAIPLDGKEWLDKRLKCSQKCTATEPAVSRVNQCDYVDWLPF